MGGGPAGSGSMAWGNGSAEADGHAGAATADGSAGDAGADGSGPDGAATADGWLSVLTFCRCMGGPTWPYLLAAHFAVHGKCLQR